MNLYLLWSILAACAAVMILESIGVQTTLSLNLKGDIKRETRWLAQYGQSVCTPLAALLVYQLDPSLKPMPLHRAIVGLYPPPA